MSEEAKLVIVFYANDGAAAKFRSRQILADKPCHARVYDVAVWQDTKDHCDAVEIMPDVPEWQIERIKNVFGDLVGAYQSPIGEEPLREIDDGRSDEVQEEDGPEPIKPVHRGGGRWYVMQGEAEISGPHNRAEAARIAAEKVTEAA